MRDIRKIVDELLKKLSPRFAKIYNLLYRWFVGLNIDETVWDPTTFTQNRDRFLTGDITNAFFNSVLAIARSRHLLSEEHFSVDSFLIQAWASHKSFKPKTGPETPPADEGRNTSVDFRGARRTNETHQSTTDPEARLYKKSSGQEAKLCYMGHVLIDNRHGLLAKACVTQASGTAEREAALQNLRDLLIERGYEFGRDLLYFAFPEALHSETYWATRSHIPFQFFFGKTPSFS